MKLSKKIYFLRKAKSYTQKELAETLGCSTISIQNYESERKNPSGLLIQKLCKQFPQYALWLVTDIEDIGSIKNIKPNGLPYETK